MKKLNEDIPPFRPGDHVLYKNNQFIAFNKPSGIAVQADQTGDKALIDLGGIYTKSRLLLVHRLDRPVSGVVVFAKTTSAQQSLSQGFRERSISKTYLAVVKNPPPEQEATLVHYLKQDIKTNRSIILNEEQPDSLQSVLHYRTIAQSDHYYLLEIDLQTGRHHQIRAQLAAIGCPVKGDVKYGARRNNPDRSIHLHAWKLRFAHPVDHSPVLIEAPLPQEALWQAFQKHLLQES